MTHESRFFGHESLFFGHESLFFGHESPIFGHESLFFGHKSPFFGHESPIFGHESQDNSSFLRGGILHMRSGWRVPICSLVFKELLFFSLTRFRRVA